MQTQTLNINIDFKQLLNIIGQCDITQKIKIAEALEKETYAVRFKQLLSELSKNDLTLDEITKEVETVRSKRYAGK
jgi:aromatic ring hydroxylase